MKIKKFLEKVADEDRESLVNDKDIEFLASIGVDYNKKREADKKEPPASYYLTAPSFNYKAFLISASCFIVLAVAVFLIVYYSLKPFEPPVGYLDVVEDITDSNLQELNKDLDLFSLIADEDKYEITTKKTYDKVSGKSLYYSITFNGAMQSFKMDIVVNSQYEYKEVSYSEELKEAQISGYTLKYTENSKSIQQGLPFIEVSCQGEMQVGEQFIYITSFTETAVGQSTFVATLSSLIKFN